MSYLRLPTMMQEFHPFSLFFMYFISIFLVTTNCFICSNFPFPFGN
jgi:hypothetical protein